MSGMKLNTNDKVLEGILNDMFDTYDSLIKVCGKQITRQYVSIIVVFIAIMSHVCIAIITNNYVYSFATLLFSYLFYSGIKKMNSSKKYLMSIIDERNEVLRDNIPKHFLIVWDQKEIK